MKVMTAGKPTKSSTHGIVPATVAKQNSKQNHDFRTVLFDLRTRRRTIRLEAFRPSNTASSGRAKQRRQGGVPRHDRTRLPIWLLRGKSSASPSSSEASVRRAIPQELKPD